MAKILGDVIPGMHKRQLKLFNFYRGATEDDLRKVIDWAEVQANQSIFRD